MVKVWYKFPFTSTDDTVGTDPLVSSACPRSSPSSSVSSDASDVGQVSDVSQLTEDSAQDAKLGLDSGGESIHGDCSSMINPRALSAALQGAAATPPSFVTFDSLHQSRDGGKSKSSVSMIKLSEKRKRFLKTVALLKSSGLLETSLRTAQLMRENQALQKELETLKRETNQFVSELRKLPR